MVVPFFFFFFYLNLIWFFNSGKSIKNNPHSRLGFILDRKQVEATI